MTPRTRTAPARLVLLGALAVGLGGLTACGGDDPEPVAETGSDPSPGGEQGEGSAGATDEPSSPEPSTPDSPAPSEPVETTSEPAGTVVPVYFTGRTPVGLRLYREFHEVAGDEPLAEAAALLVAGDASDPDYGTLLGGVTIEGVEQGDGEIVVTLGEDSPLSADRGTSKREARLAVQSLVYTLQGTAQSRDPVRVQLADGRPADLFGQPTGRGVEAIGQLDVLSLVNLTTPQEGATVSGSLPVEGVASSFEATVPFSVLDESGAEVLTDFTTAEGWIDRLYPFTAELDVSDLAPGTYTLVARTDDPSGGEGAGPFEDTRTFVVE